MKIKVAVGIAILGYVVIHDIWAGIHNRKVISQCRDLVLEIIEKTKDEKVIREGKALLIEDGKIDKKDMHQKYKEFIIQHGI